MPNKVFVKKSQQEQSPEQTGLSNGGRNNFPVSAGTGGKPGQSLIRRVESEATLRG